MGKAHVSVVPGLAQQLSRNTGSWIMKEPCHEPAGPICCTNWLVGSSWLFDSPCYPNRKTSAPKSEAEEHLPSQEGLSSGSLASDPSQPGFLKEPCSSTVGSALSLGPTNQKATPPLAVWLPEAAGLLWQRPPSPNWSGSPESSWLSFTLGPVPNLLTPVLARILLCPLS